MAQTQTYPPPPPIPSLAILSLILLILLLPWPHEHTKPTFTTALSLKDYNSYPHILYLGKYIIKTVYNDYSQLI